MAAQPKRRSTRKPGVGPKTVGRKKPPVEAKKDAQLPSAPLKRKPAKRKTGPLPAASSAVSGKLYYGDNLDVLRRHIADESVDLVYLDPPFQSGKDYNVLFEEKDGTKSTAQIRAFEDTWGWGLEAEEAYHDVVESGGRVADAMTAFRTFLGDSDMMAYLAMMAPRLFEMRRALKPTGSIYLHCDSNASHYLKMLMDSVFSPQLFLNEITWKRTTSHGNVGRNYGSVTDSIIFYAKSNNHAWNQQFRPFDPEYAEKRFSYTDSDGRRWQSVTLRNPSRRPNLRYPFSASDGTTYHPHANGWSCDKERMKRYDVESRLHFPSRAGGKLRLKMYLDESPGIRVQNLWDDISALNSQARERLGYPVLSQNSIAFFHQRFPDRSPPRPTLRIAQSRLLWDAWH